MSRNPLLAQIHIAKKELGLDDDLYRDVLERVTGSRSSAGLSDDTRKAVLAEFRRMGWNNSRDDFKPSSKAYVRKIYAIWGDLKKQGIWREKSRASLRSFVKNTTGVDDPEFLDYPTATIVIEALKKMKERADD